MSAERVTSPEQLIGMSVLDVISLLPTFSWYIEDYGRRCDVKISKVIMVSYETWKPRKEIDLHGEIPMPVDIDELRRIVKSMPRMTSGLTSIVFLDEEEYERGLYRNVAEGTWVHIPMIDADIELPELSEEEVLTLFKEEIKSKTEIKEGLILKSGGLKDPRRRLHFIGTSRLLNQNQLPTFIGLCLNMVGPDRKQLVDTKWAGHVLTPMKYFLEVEKGVEWSAYDFSTRYATLRIGLSGKKPYSELPTVIDILQSSL